MQTISPSTDNQKISQSEFKKLFLNCFEKNQGKPFNEDSNNGESGNLLNTILDYFFWNKKGFENSSLLTSLGGKTEININKGLMIIGGFGTGKTSIMKVLTRIIKDAYSGSYPVMCKDIEGNEMQVFYAVCEKQIRNFDFHTAIEVVDQYEGLIDSNYKEVFFKNHSIGYKYYDDVMTEREASNFGKIDLFKDIFTRRYTKGFPTIISTNYAIVDGKFLNTEGTLHEMGRRYGPHIYDRFFEMFNILELKGKSLRR